jgi:hypothetical protein
MSSSLTPKQWLIVILVNIVVSAITTMLIIRVMMNQPTATNSTPGTAPVAQSQPTRAPQASPLPTFTAVSQSAPPASSPTPRPAAAPTNTPSRAATATTGSATQSDVQVRISNVLYTGQRQREVAVILNEGGDVSLQGWVLASSRNISYTLPNVILFKDSFISVHTTTGSNVPTDLFMNRAEPAWQVGDVLTLSNQGQVIATYTVK